jgi:hypothetical protein
VTVEEKRHLVEAVTRKLLSKLLDDMKFLEASGIGVTIFAFTFEPGAIAYISTAEREGMLRSIKEFVAMQEAGISSEPRGERGQS